MYLYLYCSLRPDRNDLHHPDPVQQQQHQLRQQRHRAGRQLRLNMVRMRTVRSLLGRIVPVMNRSATVNHDHL